MKCPNCKGDIPTSHKGRTCPACGEPLPTKTPIAVEWAHRISGFTEDRGFFFWLLVFALFILLLAALENLLGPGDLVQLLDQHKFISLVMFIYTAAHLKIIRNIHSVNRPGYPGAYWTDRLIIKKFRLGTDRLLILGFILGLIIVGPFDLFALLPAYILIMSLFTALFWSIESFRIDDREFMDAKVMSYFNFLGIKRLRKWRQASGAYLIGLIVSGATFYGLSRIPNLWLMIRQNPTLNETIAIFTGLFSWIPMLWPKN